MASQESAKSRTDPDRLAARLVQGLSVTTRRLDLAGVSTSAFEGGEGPPIVLLHGQGGFAEIMGGLAATLLSIATGSSPRTCPGSDDPRSGAPHSMGPE